MKIYIGIIASFTMGIVSAQKVWSFNDCLSYARENNLQVLASKLNEQVQESNYKIAKNEKLPNLTGTIGNGFTFGPLATQRTSIGPSGFSISTDYKYTEGYQNDLALESSILLYNKGRLRINEEKNSLLLQQNHFTTEKIKNDVSLQLVGNYLTVLLNKELMTVENNSMNIQQQDADRNEKLYQSGSISLSTLYESKANLANASQLYENARIEVDRSLMVLAMLLQKDYRDFQIEEVTVSDDISIPLVNIDDIINYAYNNQPEIKSAELGIEAAEKDIDLAKTVLYPTITGGYKANTYYQNYFDRSVKSLEDQWYDNHSQMLSLGISIPIFNKGISRLKIEQSKINKLIQENYLDQEKLNLKQTVQAAYFDVTSSYETFTSARELVASTRLSYEFAQKSFNSGKINVYDLNIARNNYFSAQSQMLQAKYSFLFKLKILDFYIGKPLQIASDENLKYNSIPSANSVKPIGISNEVDAGKTPVEPSKDTTRPAPKEAAGTVPAPTTRPAPKEAAATVPAPTTRPAPKEAAGTVPVPTTRPAPKEAAGTVPVPTTRPAPKEAAATVPVPTTRPAPKEAAATVPVPTTRPAPKEAAATVPVPTTRPAPKEAAATVPAPTTRPAPKEAAGTVPASTTRPAPKEAAATVPAPTTRPVPKETAGTVPASTTRPAPKEAVNTVPAPTTRPAPKEAAATVPAPTTRPAPKEAAGTVPASTTRPAPKEAAATVPAPTTRPVPKETAGTVPASTTRPAPKEAVNTVPTPTTRPAPKEAATTVPAPTTRPAPKEAASAAPVTIPSPTPKEAASATPVTTPSPTPKEAASATPVTTPSSTPKEAASVTPVTTPSSTPKEAASVTPVTTPSPMSKEEASATPVTPTTQGKPQVETETTIQNKQIPSDTTVIAPENVTQASDEVKEREAKINERRSKLSQGSAELKFESDSERETMIKEKRSKIMKKN